MTISPHVALAAVLAVAALPDQAPRPAAAIAMPWRIERMIDPDSGEKTCLVISLGGDVTARLSREQPGREAVWSVLVGVDNKPGSLRYLRVNRKFFQTAEPSFRGLEAADIVARLKTPGEFVFEWIKGPDESKRGGLYGAGDFAAKAALCEAWLSGTSI